MLLFALLLLLPPSLSSSIPKCYPTQNCSNFADALQLSQYNATIVSTIYHPAQTYNVSTTFNTIPFCEIALSIAYENNNTLHSELWLPTNTSNYQDRLIAVGGGGMAGVIDYAQMLTQLNSGEGLAVAGGDSGHLAANNNNGGGAPGVYLPYLHDPAQVNAWVHNAISLFTPAAKALVGKYYGKEPAYSYYYGCSTGGAQGYALAQFHPELFDAIYAGSPGNWYSHLALSFLWNAQHTNTSKTNLTQAELNFTTNAIIDACDTLDGVADRLLENPLHCNFDINSLACNQTTTASSASGNVTCLQSSKIAAIKNFYAGPKRSDNGNQLYPGFSFGSEIEWILQEGNLADAFSIPILQNLVFNNLSYDSDTFNWASDVALLNAKAGRFIDEISPNISAFRNSGGKFLTAQGWADPYNVALWPIEHLKQVEEVFGQNKTEDFYSLFMIPGGGHCGTATYYPGVPATYHVVQAMIKWVEKGRKPEEIQSSDPPDGSGRTRKLCLWPKNARYTAGDVDSWTSFVCE